MRFFESGKQVSDLIYGGGTCAGTGTSRGELSAVRCGALGGAGGGSRGFEVEWSGQTIG